MMQQGCRGCRTCPGNELELRYLAVAVLALLTAACATLSPDSPKEEKVKVVTERATARWQAIIGKDFAAAYEYMSPVNTGDGDAGGIQDGGVADGLPRP